MRPALVDVEARAGPAEGTVASGGAALLMPSLLSVGAAGAGAMARYCAACVLLIASSDLQLRMLPSPAGRE